MLELKNVSKRYVTKGGVVNALDNVSLYLEEKGMIFVLGKSGSGKSTLLNVVGGLDKIDSGEIVIKGKSSTTFKGSDYDSYRNTSVGFVFQEYNILDDFTVAKNIGLALELQGRPAKKEDIDQILETVDLKNLGDRKPNTLSGGQKQRVAIARALVKNPEILMADEPTGALDSQTGKQIFNTLKKLSEKKLVMVVSHDRDFAEKYASRIIELADGKIISDLSKSSSGDFDDTPIRQVAENAFYIKQNTILSGGDLAALNEFIKKQNGDLFLTTQDGLSVKFNTEQTTQTDTGGFQNTKEIAKKHYEPSDFKLIHSKLPIKHAFKMGAAGLKVKPIRLAFTILLSVLSFAFFGLADTIGNFKRHNSAADLIINEQVENALVKRYSLDSWGDERTAPIYQSDIDKLKTDFPDMNFRAVYDSDFYFETTGFNFDSNGKFSGSDRAYGLTTIDSALIAANNFSIKHGRLPNAKNEIALSLDFCKSYLQKTIKTKHLDQNNYLVEQNLFISSVDNFLNITVSEDDLFRYSGRSGEVTIVGIIDCGEIASEYKNVSDFDWKLSNKANDVKMQSYATKVFVNQAYFDEIIGEKKEVNNSNVHIYTGSRTDDILYTSSFYIFNTKKDNDIFFNKSKTSLLDNEVLISLNNLHYLSPDKNTNYAEYMVSAFESSIKFSSFDENDFGGNDYTSLIYSFFNSSNSIYDDGLRFIKEYSDVLFSNFNLSLAYQSTFYGRDSKTLSGNLTCVGIFIQEENNYTPFKLNGATFTKITEQDSQPSYYYVLGTFNLNSTKSVRDFVNYSYTLDSNKIRLGLANGEIESLDGVYYMIKMFAKIFMYVGIGFAFFSALLMLNFISTSIAHKRREIGILRAIGARSNDVFSIFFSESFIIAAINAALALIVTIVASKILNNFIIKEIAINARFLFVTVRQVALIFAISIFAAFVASFLPVKKIASKKPVDSIRNT